MARLGIDLGGTKIEGVVLGSGNRELFRKRIPTEQELGYKQILANISRLYEEMAEQIDRASHTLGIVTPGAVSPKTGLLRNSNTQCLNGAPLTQDLQNLLGRELNLQNDANGFAMAEALCGAGRGKDLVFGVIMGTGCGGGIVFRGEVLTGGHAIAGEWGHHSIDADGPECYCGNRGCVETFISGGGLEKRYEARTGERLSAEEIVAAWRQGKSDAAACMRDFFGHFGRALANVIDILDPDVVVLGGGLSNIDELYTTGADEVRRRVFSDYCETAIVRNQLGDSAGVIGAALIGR